jgi:hypothetical protein
LRLPTRGAGKKRVTSRKRALILRRAGQRLLWCYAMMADRGAIGGS